MDISMMQHNYTSRYLVNIDGGVYVHIHEKCKFDQPFLCFHIKYISLVYQKFVTWQNFEGLRIVLISMVILFY